MWVTFEWSKYGQNCHPELPSFIAVYKTGLHSCHLHCTYSGNVRILIKGNSTILTSSWQSIHHRSLIKAQCDLIPGPGHCSQSCVTLGHLSSSSNLVTEPFSSAAGAYLTYLSKNTRTDYRPFRGTFDLML